AAVLLQRFWMPGANISLTRVSASPADTWVPMGESLTISAALRGRIPPGATRLFLRSGDNSIRTVSMTAVPGTPGRFDFTIGEVTDSFEYRIRAGDGQTPWHRMTAVERPRISEVTLKVMPPAYT